MEINKIGYWKDPKARIFKWYWTDDILRHDINGKDYLEMRSYGAFPFKWMAWLNSKGNRKA